MSLWVLMGVGVLAGQLAAAVLLAGQVHAQGCRPSAVFPRAGPPVQTLACEGLIFTREFDIILLVWTPVPCLQHARSTSTRARWPPLCGLSAGVLEIRHSRSHGKAIRYEKTQARYLSRKVATPVPSFSDIRHHSNEHFYGFLSSVSSLP